MTTNPRVVMDANVPIDIARKRNPDAEQVLSSIVNGEVELALGPKLWGEYQSGLWHPDTLDTRSASYVHDLLQKIADKASYTENVPRQVEMEKNRKDEHVVNLAVYKEADFIVTSDKELLKLAQNSDWQTWFPSIKVIHPKDFERELSLWQERQQEHAQQHEWSIER